MTLYKGRLPALAALLLAALCLVALPGDARAGKTRGGTLDTASTYSPALGGAIDYTVYLPAGYANGTGRYPVVYLLHGRGDTMQAWTRVKGDLDQLIQDKQIPPVIAVMPDAPWSERGSWYVDSAYTGADDPGMAVETALTRDLIAHVDATYRTAAIRNARVIGGYSMGGAGALRFALAHQDLFASALVLSPAIYTPLPPADSSTRDYGAFGRGDSLFDDDVYQKLNYPALLSTVDPNLPVRLYIAVGDDEYANPDPADAHHDLDFESEVLYNAARRVPGVSAQMRILDGGHDWDVWEPAFVAGMEDLSATLSVVPPVGLPAPLYGTGAVDWAGGVAAGTDGTVTLGYAAGGPVAGGQYAGGLDAVVTRLDGDGSPQWTTSFGTPNDERLYGVVSTPDGGVLTAGYTKGDLDGRHPGNSTDDAFVAKLDSTGTVDWVTQFGAAGTADRAYGIAAAPGGGAYLSGYTKGALDGGNAGDKDAFLARVAADGTLSWVRQLGGTGEDKAYGVAADDGGAYLVGSASAALPSTAALGGMDGWIAHFTTDGTRDWVSAAGGPGDDLLTGVAITSAGLAVATGSTGTDTAGTDALTVAYTAKGRQKWTSTVGTPGADGGAAVVALPGGEVSVLGYAGGRLGDLPGAGGADVFTLRLSGKGKQVSAGQFGSARDDGVDGFGEPNLFAALGTDGRVLVTGLTGGTAAGGQALGNGDVFLAADTGQPL